MKKIISFYSSMLVTGILVVIWAISIAYATFIENNYGANTAKILVYNARWMEILFALIALNLIGSMFRYKLINRKKWSILLFHLAFIVIVIGATITRYMSFEGSLTLNEGETKDYIVSDASFITIEAKSKSNSKTIEKEVRFSQNTFNSFHSSFELDGHQIDFKLNDFFENIEEAVVNDINGFPVLKLMASSAETGRVDFTLYDGIQKKIGNTVFSFNPSAEENHVTVAIENNRLVIAARDTISSQVNGETIKLAPFTKNNAVLNQMYSVDNTNFVITQASDKANVVLSKPANENGSYWDGIDATITIDGTPTKVIINGKHGLIGLPTLFAKNDVKISMSYGAKYIKLPFSLHLRDFQLERYPGSMSPSSFASEVTVIDPSKNLEMPYRIFMNNTLKYRGYRFFQSSYTRDEQGTILSVNSDFWGATVTYIGYLLMVLGMIFTFLNKNSHLKTTFRKLSSLKEKRQAAKLLVLAVLFSCFSFTTKAQNSTELLNIDREHANSFGELIIQDKMGRLKPVSSMSSQILRKLTKKNSYQGKSPTQIFLDMSSNPTKWYGIDIIKISHSDLRKTLKISGNFASFNDIVKPANQGGYLLQNKVNQSYQKKPVERNKLDKEIMNVDERLNVLMQVFNGDFLRVFPVPGDANHKWVTVREAPNFMNDENVKFVTEVFQNYYASLLNAAKSGNYNTANAYLNQIKEFQKKYGAKIYPSKSKIKLETMYNNLNIFNKVAKYYMFAGLILLIVYFVKIFSPGKEFKIPIRILSIAIILSFAFHTFGMGVRWYISGHAPWSNGYESMIYVGWAIILSGFLFMKKSPITLAATTVLAAIVLFVAGMSWMNPEITNLVPVLKSYWLIVHVAVITASYGFLALGALMGFLNLNLMIFRNQKNQKNLNFTISELSYIIEITLIIGLCLMTTGSFLGAVWANESWGRYWGWDPKETWSLVTILVYTFALHMRNIEGFRGQFALSTGALVSISSVLMTFFGVNYYLSGLHSYGQGDPPPIPNGVYIALVVTVIVIIAAYFSNRKMKGKPN